MPTRPYKFVTNVPPALSDVLNKLIGFDISRKRLPNKQGVISEFVRGPAKAERPKISEELLSCYFQFLTMEGMVVRSSRRGEFFVDTDRCTAVLDAIKAGTVPASMSEDKDNTRRRELEYLRLLARQRLPSISAAPVATKQQLSPIIVAMLPSGVTTPVEEAEALAGVEFEIVAVEVPVSTPVATCRQDKPRPPKTHIVFLTKDEAEVYTHIAATYDETTMRVGVPREFADFIEMFAESGLLRRLEDDGGNGHIPCEVLISPSAIVDVKIDSRRTIRRDETGALSGFEPVGIFAYGEIRDGVSFYGTPGGSFLCCLKDFESFVIAGEPARARQCQPAVSQPRFVTHSVALKPEEAATLLRMFYGEIVEATHKAVEVRLCDGEVLQTEISTSSKCLTDMLHKPSFKEFDLVFPTDDCKGYKFRRTVAEACKFVERRVGAHQTMVLSIPGSRRIPVERNNWIDDLRAIAGSLFVETVVAPTMVAEPITKVEVKIEDSGEPKRQLVDRFVIFVTRKEAEVFLLVNGQRLRIGIDAVSAPLVSELKKAGLLVNHGGNNQTARFEFTGAADERLEFKKLPAAYDSRFEIVPNSEPRNGEWRKELEVIAGRSTEEVVAEFEALRAARKAKKLPQEQSNVAAPSTALPMSEAVVPDSVSAEMPESPEVAVDPKVQTKLAPGLHIHISDPYRLPEPEDLSRLSGEQLVEYLAVLDEMSEVIKAKRAAIATELAEREERRRVEAEKAHRRAELEAELISKRAVAEVARRQAEEAAAVAAAIEAELAAL